MVKSHSLEALRLLLHRRPLEVGLVSSSNSKNQCLVSLLRLLLVLLPHLLQITLLCPLLPPTTTGRGILLGSSRSRENRLLFLCSPTIRPSLQCLLTRIGPSRYVQATNKQSPVESVLIEIKSSSIHYLGIACPRLPDEQKVSISAASRWVWGYNNYKYIWPACSFCLWI